MVCNALISALLGLALGAFCAAAGQAQSAATPSATTPSATRIVIGAHMPMTGALARTGRSLDEGLRVAFDACNAAQTRYRFELEEIDDESTPAKAVSAVEKLAASDVTAIIGGYGSNIVGPASDTAEKLGKTYITTGAISDELTARGLKGFFRINNNAGYLRGIAGLLSELKPRAVAIIASTKEAPILLAEGLVKELGAKGITVTLHKFDPAITDFKPIVNKIKLQDKPDIIMMSAYENDYVGIIRAAKVLKPDIKLIVGAWSLAAPNMYQDFPELASNVVGATFLPFPVEMKSEEGQRFSKAYKKMFGKEVEYGPVLSFAMTMVLCEAIVRAGDAGTLARGGLPDELRRTDRPSIVGRIQFDATGDNPYFSLSMAQHQAGKVVLVWPKEAATGTLIYPGLPW